MADTTLSSNQWININGTVYAIDDEATYKEVSQLSTAEQKTKIETLTSSGQATQVTKAQLKSAGISEDEMTELDLDENVYDLSTEGEDGKTSLKESSAYSESSWKEYAKSVGIDYNNEEPGLDELEAALKKIEGTYDELEKAIEEIENGHADPDSIDKTMSELMNGIVSIDYIGQSIGMDSLVSQDTIFATTALSMGGAAVATAATTGTIAATMMVAGVSVNVPVVGWAVAIGCGFVALGMGIYNAVQQGKIDDLKEKVNESYNKFSELWKKGEEGIATSGGEIVDQVNEDLDGLLEDSFNFDDVTDVENVTDNLDKIIQAQAKIEPWANLAEKYGIEIEGLSDLADKLGRGDEPLTYAQSYLDAYAEQVNMNLEDEVIKDTETLNKLHEDITSLSEQAKEKGLDTGKLEDLLEKFETTNQEEADDTASDIASGSDYSAGAGAAGYTGTGTGGTGSGASYVDSAAGDIAAAQAGDSTAQSVQEGSTQYETSTSSLEDAAKTRREAAQKQVDSYLASIETSGLSIEELEELYTELSANQSAFKEISSELDLSGFDTKLSEIRKAQQTKIQEYTTEIQSRVQSATTTEERKALLSELQGTMSQYADINIDLSGLVSLTNQIIQNEQISIEQKSQQYQQEASNLTSSDQAVEVINRINIEISNSSGMQCDTSALTEAINVLNAKLDELLKKELSITVNQNTEVNTEVNPNINVEINQTQNTENNNDNSQTGGEEPEAPNPPVTEPDNTPPDNEEPVTPPPSDNEDPDMPLRTEQGTDIPEQPDDSKEEVQEPENKGEEAPPCDDEDSIRTDMGAGVETEDEAEATGEEETSTETETEAAAEVEAEQAAQEAEEAADDAQQAANSAEHADTVQEAEQYASDAQDAAETAEEAAGEFDNAPPVDNGNIDIDETEADDAEEAAEAAADEAQETAQEAEAAAEENDDNIEITVEE